MRGLRWWAPLVVRLGLICWLMVDCTLQRPRSPTPSPAPAPGSPPISTPYALPRPAVSPHAERGQLPVTPTPTPTLVFLDPGHGGADSGGVGTLDDGSLVEEKTYTLALAEKTAQRLRAQGVGVALSRTGDWLPGAKDADPSSVLTSDAVLRDLQNRIDAANASGARVFLSIHLNYYPDPAVGGAETFYDSARPFGDVNAHFARLVQTHLIAALRSQGYETPDRGITDDQALDTDSLGALAGYNHFVVLGPGLAGRLRPTVMPGALSEPFFISNPPEATAIAQSAVQDLIADSYAAAIEQFLNEHHLSGSASP